MKKAYALVFEGYADWELGNVLAELRRLGKVAVVSVGIDDQKVVSMGGLNVTPDMGLSEVPFDDILIFILPGGYLWEEKQPPTELLAFLRKLEKSQIPIAAICAATTVLAKAGVLDERRHTSNSLKYLQKAVPAYKGSERYVDRLATRDKRVITASGLGSVDFTMAVLEELDLANAKIRKVWLDAFKHGVYPEQT